MICDFERIGAQFYSAELSKILSVETNLTQSVAFCQSFPRLLVDSRTFLKHFPTTPDVTLVMNMNTSEAPEQVNTLPKKGSDIELTIESLAYGGNGLARIDGYVIFVERAIPGQTVLARITKRKKGYGEARVLEVITESPDAVEPNCPHFGVCGGCRTQNLPYQQQLQEKQTQVEGLFAKMGGFSDVKVAPIIGCEEIYHYRNKMEFTWSPRAWMVSKDDLDKAPDRALGLHVPGRYDKILDLTTCYLQPEVCNQIFNFVKVATAKAGLKLHDIKSHIGYLRHLVLRTATNAEGELEIMVNFVTSYEAPELLKPIVDDLINTFPNITSVMNNITSSMAGVAYGESEILLHGKPLITQQLRGLVFDISANSFFQTNSAQAEVLFKEVQKACALTGKKTVYDLFCGTGTIALSLAKDAKDVVGFEVVESAIDDAARNAIVNEIFNAKFYHADLNRRYFTENAKRLQKNIAPPDIVVSDPPRSGMTPKMVGEILVLDAPRVVYISCNPATQVRDMKLLCEGGYQLKSVQPVDMFPHTPHIETVCVLEK